MYFRYTLFIYNTFQFHFLLIVNCLSPHELKSNNGVCTSLKTSSVTLEPLHTHTTYVSPLITLTVRTTHVKCTSYTHVYTRACHILY